MRTCQVVRKQLSQYFDGEVSPRQAGQIAAHLQRCAECRQEWARMKELVAALNSAPHEEMDVDLFPQFQQRLTEQRGKPRPRWTTRRFPRYALAIAGLTFALLVFGGLVGLHSALEDRLYISKPRQLNPALFTSMAIAASTIQNDKDADALLLADSRLNALIDVQARGETLEQVITELANKTSVRLDVEPALANQRVYLHLLNVPISTVLSEIRQLVSGAWQMSCWSDGKRYTLVAPPQVLKIADAVASAQALAAAGEEMSSMKANQPLCANDQVSGLLDDEVISTLMTGKEYHKPYTEMTAQQQKLFRHWVNKDNPRYQKVWKQCRLNIALKRGWDGMIWVRFDHTPASISTLPEMLAIPNKAGMGETGEESVTVFNPIASTRESSIVESISLTPFVPSLSLLKSVDAQYQDAALAVKLGNEKKSYTMLEMFDLIAQRTKYHVVADYYTVEECESHKLAGNLPLDVLLFYLDKDYNIAWSLDQQRTLRLVHRQWPLLRQTEPPRGLVERITRNYNRRGFLELDDLSALMRLTDMQYVGTINALHNAALTESLYNMRSRLSDALKYYAELPPAQQQAARSTAGLRSTTLTAQERASAYKKANNIWSNWIGYLPNTTTGPFNWNGPAAFSTTFSVIRRSSTWGELQKLYHCPFITTDDKNLTTIANTALKTYYPGSTSEVDMTAKHEFLLLRWSGTVDAIYAIQLPAKSDPAPGVNVVQDIRP